MFILSLHKRSIIDKLKQSNHDSFFIYSVRKGMNFRWNGRSCFLEMLLCLAAFRSWRRLRGTGGESHSAFEIKLKFLIRVVRLSSHSEFILSGHIPGFMNPYYYLWFPAQLKWRPAVTSFIPTSWRWPVQNCLCRAVETLERVRLIEETSTVSFHSAQSLMWEQN